MNYFPQMIIFVKTYYISYFNVVAVHGPNSLGFLLWSLEDKMRANFHHVVVF
jgi:hypothetical protein